MLADDGVEDLHQLHAAVDQVIQSRRVLAWSYVFKLYQFEDDAAERELQLFETYQGKLEHMTETLQSRLTEIPTSSATKSLNASSSSRSPLSGAAADGGDAFRTWRQGVVHLMGAVRSFAVNVVEFAANSDVYAGAGMEWEVREKDPVLETQKERVVWAWCDDSRTWNPYSDENIRIIEEAHTAGDASVTITSSGRRYRIDLRGMRQTNLDTRGSRTIRRTVESGASWTCARCSYHNAGSDMTCMMCEAERPG